MSDIKQALRDFVVTSNSGKYKNEGELISKFPELASYDIQALRDFVTTSNSGKYQSEDELFSKFPEFSISTTLTPQAEPQAEVQKPQVKKKEQGSKTLDDLQGSYGKSFSQTDVGGFKEPEPLPAVPQPNIKTTAGGLSSAPLITSTYQPTRDELLRVAKATKEMSPETLAKEKTVAVKDIIATEAELEKKRKQTAREDSAKDKYNTISSVLRHSKPAEDMSYIERKARSGMLTLGSSIYRTPEFVYDIATNAYNLLLEAQNATIGTNAAPLPTSSEILKKLEVSNAPAEIMETAAREIQKVESKYDKSIIESIKEGEYGTAVVSTAGAITESLPFTLAIMIPGLQGASIPQTIAGTTLVTGAGRKQDVKQEISGLQQELESVLADKTIPQLEKDQLANEIRQSISNLSNETLANANSIAHGLAESLEVLMGAGSFGRNIRTIAQKEGVGKAKQFAVNVFDKVIKDNPYLAPFSEGIQEGLTTYLQNVSDVTILKQDKEVTEGIADAFIVGAVMGSGFTAATEVAKYSAKRENISRMDEFLDGISSAATNGKVYENVMNDIDQKVNLMQITPEQAQEQKGRIDNTIAAYNAMPTELSREQQREALPLIIEKREIEAKIEGKDPAMIVNEKARIEEINNKLQEISNKQGGQDAVQISETAEVDAREQARDSEGVGAEVSEQAEVREEEGVEGAGQAEIERGKAEIDGLDNYYNGILADKSSSQWEKDRANKYFNNKKKFFEEERAYYVSRLKENPNDAGLKEYITDAEAALKALGQLEGKTAKAEITATEQADVSEMEITPELAAQMEAKAQEIESSAVDVESEVAELEQATATEEVTEAEINDNRVVVHNTDGGSNLSDGKNAKNQGAGSVSDFRRDEYYEIIGNLENYGKPIVYESTIKGKTYLNALIHNPQDKYQGSERHGSVVVSIEKTSNLPSNINEILTQRVISEYSKKQEKRPQVFKPISEQQAIQQPKEQTKIEVPELKDVESTAKDIESKRIATDAKIKRKDLFDGVGEFSTQLGGSDKAAVPISHKEKNGIEIVEYAHPETGSVDVIVTGKSDNDFVGFYRIYENGKPTNKWSSKFENQSRNKDDFKTMISGIQEMLPAGHEYTEKTSISTDGLRIWNQQLNRGYELQYDENGKLKTNRVFINGDAIVNELGIPVEKGDFEKIKVKTREDFEKVKAKLLPYLEKFGLDESSIKWISGNVEITPQNEKAFASTASVKIDLPVLKKSESLLSKEQTTAKEVAPALRDVESTAKALEGKDITSVISPDEINTLNKKLYDNLLNKQKELLSKGVKDFENNAEYKQIKKQIALSESLINNDSKAISEAYHKAKADGTNPELVKAVESLLVKEQPKAEAPKSKEQSKKQPKAVSSAVDKLAAKLEAKAKKPAKEKAEPSKLTKSQFMSKAKVVIKGDMAQVKLGNEVIFQQPKIQINRLERAWKQYRQSQLTPEQIKREKNKFAENIRKKYSAVDVVTVERAILMFFAMGGKLNQEQALKLTGYKNANDLPLMVSKDGSTIHGLMEQVADDLGRPLEEIEDEFNRQLDNALQGGIGGVHSTLNDIIREERGDDRVPPSDAELIELGVDRLTAEQQGLVELGEEFLVNSLTSEEVAELDAIIAEELSEREQEIKNPFADFEDMENDIFGEAEKQTIKQDGKQETKPVREDGKIGTKTKEGSETSPTDTRKDEAKREGEQKSLADKIRNLKAGDNRAFDATIGIPVAVYNGAVELVATSVEAGIKLGNAIAKAMKYIDSKMGGKKWNKGLFAKEMNVRYSVTLPNGSRVEVERDITSETAEVINGWYQPIEQKILDAKTETKPANKWAEYLRSKEDEDLWTGVRAFLESKGTQSVTKKELQDFIKNNRVEIVEVVKRENFDAVVKQYDGSNFDISNIPGNEDLKVGDWIVLDGDGLPTNIFASTKAEALKEARELYEEEGVFSQTKFSSYQLEGEKENYKEVLVTLPSKSSSLDDTSIDLYGIPFSQLKVEFPNGYESKEQRVRDVNERMMQSGEAGKQFKSSHFDEPNILVHLRMNTRTDADGNKVLFLDELQSDWGQKGKKEGFKISEAEQKARNYYPTQGVPQAPFVTSTPSWVKLGIKTAIKEAVNQGATKIAWTTGEQQFERWGSEKIDWVKMDSPKVVHVGKNNWGVGENRFDTETEAKEYAESIKGDNVWIIDVAEQYRGTAFEGMNVDEKAISKKGVYITSKADLKAAIDRALSREKTETERQKLTDRIWDRMQKEDKGTSLPRKEGMEGFYDVTVRDVAKAVVKELTGQEGVVSGVEIQIKEGDASVGRYINPTITDAGYGMVRDTKNSNKEIYSPTNNRAEADAWLKEKMSNKENRGDLFSTQQSIEITPELKASVQAGIPLFGTAKAKAELAAAKKAFDNKLKSGLQSGGLAALPEFARLVKAYAKVGILTAQDFLKRFKEDFKDTTFSDKDIVGAYKSVSANLQKEEALKQKVKDVREQKNQQIEDIKRSYMDRIKQIRANVKNAKETREELTKFISENITKDNGFTDTDIKRLNSLINKVTPKNYIAALDRASKLLDAHREKLKGRVIKQVYNEAVKNAKVTTTASGRKRSDKLTAEDQSFMKEAAMLLKAILNKNTQALLKIADSINAVKMQPILFKQSLSQPLTAEEKRLLDRLAAFELLGDIENMTLEEVQDILKDMKELFKQGRQKLIAKKAAKAQEKQIVQNKAATQIQQRAKSLYVVNEDGETVLKDPDQIAATRISIRKSFKEGGFSQGVQAALEKLRFSTMRSGVRSITRSIAILDTLTNALDNPVLGLNFFRDNVYKLLARGDSKEIVVKETLQKAMDDIAKKIFGSKSDYKKVLKLLRGEPIPIRLYSNISKSYTDVYIDRDIAMKVLAWSLNPDTNLLLQNQNIGQTTIDLIKSVLGDKLVKFAEETVAYLSSENYEQVNKVYSELNNRYLPQIENYFPRRSAVKLGTKEIMDGDLESLYSAMNQSFLNDRSKVADLKILGAGFSDILDEHFNGVAKYLAYAEIIQKLNNVFASPDVNAFLSEIGLKSLYKSSVIFSINPESKRDSSLDNTITSTLQSISTVVTLGLKPIQVVKQSISFLNEFPDYNVFKNRPMFIVDFPAFLIEYAIKSKGGLDIKTFKRMYDLSPSFRNRVRGYMSGDLTRLESGINKSKRSVTERLKESKFGRTKIGGREIGEFMGKNSPTGDIDRMYKTALNAFTSLGDANAVIAALVVYDRNIANGMPHEQALEIMEEYNTRQQSLRAMDKSALQRNANFVSRYLLMYASAPLLQLNKTMSAGTNIMRSIFAGKPPRAYDVRTFYINYAVANILFTLANNMFKLWDGDDEDVEEVMEELKMAALGINTLQNIPILGAKITQAWYWLNDINREAKPGVDFLAKWERQYNEARKEGKGEIRALLRPSIELATKLNTDPFVGMYKGYTGESNADDLLYDLIGVSKSARPWSYDVKKDKSMKEEDPETGEDVIKDEQEYSELSRRSSGAWYDKNQEELEKRREKREEEKE